MRICATCEQAIGNAKLFAAAITAAVIDAPCCHRAFAQTWHSTGRCICAVVAVLCQARQQAAGSMSGQCPFWDLLLAWKFVLLRVFPEFPCERPLGLLRAGGGFRVAQAGQALIRAMSKTANEGKGCACVAYLCAVLSIFTTLLPSCKLCSWLAFRALATLPTAA